MADHSDRHYALFSNNQHPLQLNCYDQYNGFLQEMHDKNIRAEEQEEGDRMKEVMKQRSANLNTSEGEQLGLDDLQDIYIQVHGEMRQQRKMSLNTRDKNGDIADYLESRRPWGATTAQNN